MCSALFVAACSDDGGPRLGDVTDVTNVTNVTNGGGEGDGSWTVFVYMAADNNLESDGLDDINEMMAGVTDNVNLFVLNDRSAQDDFPYTGDPIDGVPAYSGAHLLHVTPAGVKDLQDLGEIDMADPAMLVASATTVFEAYPAEHTALVLWDHANGWEGYSDDGSSGNGLMSPDQMQAALTEVLQRSGMDRFSVVSFDACLMAELEVALSMAPVADYLLASEQTVPNHGMDYAVLGEATSGDAEHFGATMIDGFRQHSEVADDVAGVTMSLLDLAKMNAVSDAVAGLHQAIAADPATAVEFLRGADRAAAFAYDDDPGKSFHLRDLGQIGDYLVAGGTSLAAASAQLVGAVDDAVVAHFEGVAFTGAHGLSVYAPISIEYFRSDFNDVSTATTWSALLDTAYGGGADSVGGTDTSFTGVPVASFENGQISIAAQVSGEAAPNIASVTVFYGAFVPAQDGFPDLLLMLGRLAGDVLDPATGVVGGALPVLQLGISGDGGSTGLLGVFSPIPSPDGTTTILSVPVRYMAPGVAVDDGLSGFLELTLDADANIVGRALYLRSETGALAAVTPDPNGTLQTIVLQLGADGSVVPVPSEMYTTPPSLPAVLDSYSIAAQAVAPGDGTVLGGALGFGVVVVDAGGTTHITFAKYTG
ncbi:MAG: clostripain-related cysteine peptidase [Actinomycetota bacterium]|nr:clostripain-related cysteine peptidase [Actinomycetota bacterium]